MSKNKYQYTRMNGRKLRVHRLVMEEKLGRVLEPNEHVYHLDGDRSNNEPDNLIIIIKNLKN